MITYTKTALLFPQLGSRNVAAGPECSSSTGTFEKRSPEYWIRCPVGQTAMCHMVPQTIIIIILLF